MKATVTAGVALLCPTTLRDVLKFVDFDGMENIHFCWPVFREKKSHVLFFNFQVFRSFCGRNHNHTCPTRSFRSTSRQTRHSIHLTPSGWKTAQRWAWIERWELTFRWKSSQSALFGHLALPPTIPTLPPHAPLPPSPHPTFSLHGNNFLSSI